MQELRQCPEWDLAVEVVRSRRHDIPDHLGRYRAVQIGHQRAHLADDDFLAAANGTQCPDPPFRLVLAYRAGKRDTST